MALSKSDREFFEKITQASSRETRASLEAINATVAKFGQTLYGPNGDKDFVADSTQAIRDMQTERKVQRRMIWGAIGTAVSAIAAQLVRWFSHS